MFSRVLIAIGKPFYYLLLASINLLLFIFFFTGKLFLLGLNFINNYKLPKLPRLPTLRLPRLRRGKRSRGRPKKPWYKKLLPAINHKLRTNKRKLILLAICYLLFAFGIYLPFLKGLPRPSDLITRHQLLTTRILDRHGELLFKIYKDQNRTLVKLEDIPDSLKLATLAIEDKDFYTHGGFSYIGILRAARRNIFDQKLQGGSTITQQLVKNALLTPEKTITRKVREIILSILVEIKFSKDEILEMYFNEVAYGGVAFGVEEASQMYFGKNVQNLNLSESALLAGLPAAPTTYSPFGSHPELAKTRQAEVLRRMTEENFITPLQAETAKTLPLQFVSPQTNILAPHFVMYVRDALAKNYGEAAVLQGGLTVTTTLDLNLQNAAQQAVTQELDKLTRLHIGNGAALVTNPKTGEILAMVGSKNYFDTNSDGQVNVTIRPRQPGSSIKPVNYAVALENGFTPASIIPDTPICYSLPGQKPYCPRNYDNKFHGSVTLRQALASSYNVPAVKVLSINGVEAMIKKGQLMGITTWDDPSRFGLSLTLGGGDVTMIDMATVYGSLANLGRKIALQSILKVTDSTGKVLQEFNASPIKSEQVLTPSVAYQLTHILSDNIARTPAFGTHSVLNVPNHQVAVKTGTTQNLRDNWTIGYTTDFVILTWVGNNDNSPMSYVASGITGASPIWRHIIDYLLTDKPQHTFPTPDDLIKINICIFTGQLPCQGCPTREELFITGTEPKTHCTQEQIQKLIEDKKKQDEQDRDQILTGSTSPN